MKAWKLLSKRGKWCQHASAMDKDMLDVSPKNGRAVQFCMLGAITRCYKNDGEAIEKKLAVAKAIEAKTKRKGLTDGFGFRKVIATWNDDTHRKKSEVVALLKSLNV